MAQPGDSYTSRRPARVVCLLPARNCADDLPGWFDAVRPVADAVIALDDGSTDATGELLEREPLVEVVLRRPRRESFHAWDDGANRNWLLERAVDVDAHWILSLDADERLSADDAAALRRFVDDEAEAG